MPDFIPTHAPPALRELKQWLVWRYEKPLKEGAKPRKVPYYVAGGRRAGLQGGEDDRRQLAKFDVACKVAKRDGYTGVGLAMLDGCGITALDFDELDVERLPPELADLAQSTYTELSPSGKGLRAFVLGSYGNRKSLALAGAYGIETFSSTGFVTFTGHTHMLCALTGAGDTIARVPSFDQVFEARFEHVDREHDLAQEVETEPAGLSVAQLQECLDALPNDLHYDDWLRVGMAVHCETHGSDDGFELWHEWSCKSTKDGAGDPDYNMERWRSFGRYGGRQFTGRGLVHMANMHGADINLNRPASMDEFEALGDELHASDAASKPAEAGEADELHASNAASKPAEADEFEVLEELPPKKVRFQPVSMDEFMLRPPPSWIIQDVLPRAELVFLYGPPSSGKSFMALDLAATVHYGKQWRDRWVKKGRVVYLIAEGQGGFRNRVHAYTRHFGYTPGFDIIPANPSLLERKDTLDLAKAIGRADLVIIDTLAQVTPGADENSSIDMGKALAHLKGLHKATGATILVVHHTGKDVSKGTRGWSGLHGAADASLETLRQSNYRTLRLAKNKDGPDGGVWPFDLAVVPIDMDERGEVMSSCVIDHLAETPQAVAEPRKWAGRQRVVMDVLQEFSQAQTTGIEIKAVVARCLELSDPPEDGKRDFRPANFRKTIKQMAELDDPPFEIEDDETLTIN